MAFVEAECSNCGAKLKVDSEKKTAKCINCGTEFLIKDTNITNNINNITNIKYSENIAGVEINRKAVLEKLLLEYYAENFDDIDNLKEYAFKVLECEINNPLAQFVAFKNIDERESIRTLLSNENLDIGQELFIKLLNICGDNLNNPQIINNIVNYGKKENSLALLKEIINKLYIRDVAFILELIYSFKLSENENNEILDELYDNTKTNKIIMLAQLKVLKTKHQDFQYDEKKFDDYTQHWKDVKRKQLELRKEIAKNEETQKKEEDEKRKLEQRKKLKNKYIYALCLIMLSLALLIIFLILN